MYRLPHAKGSGNILRHNPVVDIIYSIDAVEAERSRWGDAPQNTFSAAHAWWIIINQPCWRAALRF
jgi:hypothetical protein